MKIFIWLLNLRLAFKSSFCLIFLFLFSFKSKLSKTRSEGNSVKNRGIEEIHENHGSSFTKCQQLISKWNAHGKTSFGMRIEKWSKQSHWLLLIGTSALWASNSNSFRWFWFGIPIYEFETSLFMMKVTDLDVERMHCTCSSHLGINHMQRFIEDYDTKAI